MYLRQKEGLYSFKASVEVTTQTDVWVHVVTILTEYLSENVRQREVPFLYCLVSFG